MEGNLNRARNTLHSRPSSSMSSFTNQSPEAPSMYKIPRMKISPARHRQASSPPTAGNHKGHARVFSETSVPSTLQTPSHRDKTLADGPRSSSALGSTSAEHSPEVGRNWFWTGLARNGNPVPRNNYSLEAVDEDGPAPATFDHSPPLTRESIAEDEEGGTAAREILATRSDFKMNSPTVHTLTRARSTNQMRDLRDQMQDLKGKISSLKQRAKEDSLRRRSLQSLRTPSPFTAAEQWYDESPTHQASSHEADANFNKRSSGQHGESAAQEFGIGILEQAERKSNGTDLDVTPRNSKGAQRIVPENEPPAEQPSSEDSSASIPDSADNSSDQNGSDPPYSTQEGEEDSLNGDADYQSPSVSPVGERHEDRPDAFDYEHFFLHSGTGTLARRDSIHSSGSDSDSSTYSVETTKPSNHLHPDHEREDGRPNSTRKRGHERNNSVTSISTTATYATATEGKGSEGEASDDDWILHHPIAGSWTSERSAKRRNHLHTDNSQSGSGKRHAPPKTKASTDSNPVPAVPSPFLTPQQPTDDIVAVLNAVVEGGEEALELSDGDLDLVQRLICSLARVCRHVQRMSSAGGSKYEERMWRRRLDAARRVLDGEMNGEPF